MGLWVCSCVKMRHYTCRIDVCVMALIIKVSFYCDDVQVKTIWNISPHYNSNTTNGNSLQCISFIICSVWMPPYTHSTIYHTKQRAICSTPLFMDYCMNVRKIKVFFHGNQLSLGDVKQFLIIKYSAITTSS